MKSGENQEDCPPRVAGLSQGQGCLTPENQLNLESSPQEGSSSVWFPASPCGAQQRAESSGDPWKGELGNTGCPAFPLWGHLPDPASLLQALPLAWVKWGGWPLPSSLNVFPLQNPVSPASLYQVGWWCFMRHLLSDSLADVEPQWGQAGELGCVEVVLDHWSPQHTLPVAGRLNSLCQDQVLVCSHSCEWGWSHTPACPPRPRGQLRGQSQVL